MSQSCAVSQIMEWGINKLNKYEPFYGDYLYKGASTSRLDIKHSGQDIDELIEIAKKWDKDNNQPDCENDFKKKLLLDLARKLNITLKSLEE